MSGKSQTRDYKGWKKNKLGPLVSGRSGLRILCWDIEATNLNANFGYVLCVGWKRLGRPPKVLDITKSPNFKQDCTDDKWLVEQVGIELAKADLWVTWYGSRFDVPFINSRLIHHGYSPLPPIPHIDGWRTARYKMKLNSNRLASVSAFLEVEDKTPLSGPIWIRAAAGHEPAIRYVVQHCKQDTTVLEQVYEQIRPLVTAHPNVSLMRGIEDGCPYCGGFLKEENTYQAQTRCYQRFQCIDCGGWARSTASEPEKAKMRPI